MYCDRDEMIVTWSSFDKQYERVVGQKHPWTLEVDERRRVEEAIGSCPCGGRFSFTNPPLCPCCHESLASLVPDAIYYIVTGKQLEADRDRMWLT